MNKTCIKGIIYVLALCIPALVCFQPLKAAADQPYSFTAQELDDLLAPIALYPDPLLAQILPATTYPEEVSDAAAWLQRGGSPYDIDTQNWDENVRAIAHYPDILYMMSWNMDWTADLGDAFLNQPEDVIDAIQRLREQAVAAGNLANNDEQTIVTEDGYIEIIPTQPQYVYIPQYDPAVVYVRIADAYTGPFIAFGLGLAIGEWLNMDFDWGRHHIIYHGWNRRGWVNKARPHVHRSKVYIDKSRPYINQIWRHDPYHGDPEKYRRTRPPGLRGILNRMPEIRGEETTPAKPAGDMFGPRGDTRPLSIRGRESRTQQTKPAQGAAQQPPSVPNVIRSRPQTSAPTPAPVQPREIHQDTAPSGGFGGYREAGETRKESLRGQSSRQSSPGGRPATSPAGRASGGGRKSMSR